MVSVLKILATAVRRLSIRPLARMRDVTSESFQDPFQVNRGANVSTVAHPGNSRFMRPFETGRAAIQSHRSAQLGDTNHSDGIECPGQLEHTPDRRDGWQRFVETLIVFVCFAAFAGQIPPDINESHYLTKAKHFWDPEWVAGDIFLESSFAHWFFYMIAGWLTQFMSLSSVAWTGRLVTWALLAFGWQRFSWSVAPARWMSVVAALFFLLLNDQFHLAGEWVVGGFEAKGIAYFFVLLALGSMTRRRWQWVWPLLGGAMAFHVLVGGWAFFAALIAWAGTVWKPDCEKAARRSSFWHELRPQVLSLLAGIAMGLIGAIPPLMADSAAAPETAALARLIYVNHRIAHHLTFDAFATINVARFALIVVFWFLLYQWIGNHLGGLHRKLRPVFLFGFGSLVFSFGGLILSGVAEQSDQLALDCASLLRFYWFRIADFSIPAGIAMASCAIIWNWLATDRRLRTRLSCALFIVCMVGASGYSIQKKYVDSRPRADRRREPGFSTDPVRAIETLQNSYNTNVDFSSGSTG